MTLVTVLAITTVTLVPLQASLAIGASKVQAVPQSDRLLVAQVNSGGVVSITVTVWLHVAVLPHAGGPPGSSDDERTESVGLRAENGQRHVRAAATGGGRGIEVPAGPQATTLFAGQLTTSGVAQGALHLRQRRR